MSTRTGGRQQLVKKSNVCMSGAMLSIGSTEGRRKCSTVKILPPQVLGEKAPCEKTHGN